MTIHRKKWSLHSDLTCTFDFFELVPLQRIQRIDSGVVQRPRKTYMVLNVFFQNPAGTTTNTRTYSGKPAKKTLSHCWKLAINWEYLLEFSRLKFENRSKQEPISLTLHQPLGKLSCHPNCQWPSMFWQVWERFKAHKRRFECSSVTVVISNVTLVL